MFQDNTTKIAKPPLRTVCFKAMDELDDVWQELLFEAARSNSARGHFADFLAVKAANDRIRERAVEQLFAAFERIAGHANRSNAGIEIETKDPHRFTFEKASVSGASIKFRQGVRCLTVEAGWTRTPNDGFMRGNALAVARITHFGMPRADNCLKLLKFEEKVGWFKIDADEMRVSVELEDLIGHFRTFLG